MAEAIQIDLALQGGGAHGAYTWGVLERLLDERRLHYVAISGASAGSMNAVVLADGLLSDGRTGAQRAMRSFWKNISRSAQRYSAFSDPFHTLFMPDIANLKNVAPWATAHAFWSKTAEVMTKSFSPYQWNPLNLNPLLDLLERTVDFERLRATQQIHLFVAATSVRTGALRIFRNSELTPEVIMASACLPQLFQAVEIDDEPYWDGGYTGNPALLPLIAESDPLDLLIVQLNPSFRAEHPRDAGAIASRLNEITFNSGLVKEVRSIALLKQALDEEPLDRRFANPLFSQIRQLRLHRIAADATIFRPGAQSKLDPEWDYLTCLHDQGVAAAEEWIKENWSNLGKRSTLDLTKLCAGDFW